MDFENSRFYQCVSCNSMTELAEDTAVLYFYPDEYKQYIHLHIVCQSCGSASALFYPKNPDALVACAEYFGLGEATPAKPGKRTLKAYEYLYGSKPTEPKKPKKPKELPAPDPFANIMGMWKYLLETRSIHEELEIPEIEGGDE